MIPSLWREELYHPLVAHLPIGLLLSASLFSVAYLLHRKPYVRLVILWNLVLGVATAWLSIYLGQNAEDIINRVICDPTVTHVHEDYAFYSSWVFSAALILAVVREKLTKHIVVEILFLVLMLTGAGLLGYTGHLGASLVYQQGAGVYHPTNECTEFE